MRLALKKINKENFADIDFYYVDELYSNLEYEFIEKLEMKKLEVKDLYTHDLSSRSEIDFSTSYGLQNEVLNVLDTIEKENIPLDDALIVITNKNYIGHLYNILTEAVIPFDFTMGLPISYSNIAKFIKLYLERKENQYGISATKNFIHSPLFKKASIKNSIKESGEVIENLDMEVYSALGNLRIGDDHEENINRIKEYKNSLEELLSEYESIKSENQVPTLNSLDKEIEEIKEKLYVIDSLEEIENLFTQSPDEFIKKFLNIRYVGTESNSKIDKKLSDFYEKFDKLAFRTIKNSMRDLQDIYKSDEEKYDLLKDILNTSIQASFNSSDKKDTDNMVGSLRIVDIDQAVNYSAKHIFILGMSQEYYPKKYAENYLLLDCDIANILKSEVDKDRFEKIYKISLGKDQLDEVFNSENINIEDDKRSFENLIDLYKKMGAKIHLSYANYNLAELKKDVASNLFYKLFKEERHKDWSEEESTNKNFGKYEIYQFSRNKNNEEKQNIESRLENNKDKSNADTKLECALEHLKNKISPSELLDFYNCKKTYYYDRLLGLRKWEDKDEPFKYLEAHKYGTLLHLAFEISKKLNYDKEEFKNLAEKMLKVYVTERNPIVSKEVVKSEMEEFLTIIENMYHANKNYDLVTAEEKVSYTFSNGNKEHDIKIEGYIDNISKFEDKDEYVIIDYKTGKTNKHVKDQPFSCLQGILYAYIWENQPENKGKKISHIEFQYPRLNETAICEYNEENIRLILGSFYQDKELSKDLNTSEDQKPLLDEYIEFLENPSAYDFENEKCNNGSYCDYHGSKNKGILD